MAVLLVGSIWSSIWQLFIVVVVFVLILFATYYVTKWIAKSGYVQTQSKNISVVETFKVAPNKYIQIIKLGNKYYSIGVSKENITFLTELTEEQLDFTKADVKPNIDFKDVLNKVLPKRK